MRKRPKHPSHWKGKKLSEETRRKMSLAHKRGKDSPLWRGGVTDEIKKIRGSIEYRLWRDAVFTRDDHTCQECGKRGGELNADHIKPFALFPELRFVVSNGRTLCEPCHKKTPTYGKRLSQLRDTL